MSNKRITYTKQTLSLFWAHARRYPRFLWPILVVIPMVVLLGEFARPFITAQVLSRLATGTYDPHNLWGSFGLQIILYAAASIAYGIIGWRVAFWLLSVSYTHLTLPTKR